MSLDKQVKEFLLKHFPPDAHFILGMSGGMDSMVLGHLLLESQTSFSIAHINYQLRGEESQQDEAFVLDWANAHNIIVDSIKAPSNHDMDNVQNWARKVRRNHFENCLKKQKASCILLAHHLDDQWETQWLQMLRGSVNGLGGIHKIQLPYARPLLYISKKEIETYAQVKNLTWREDSSNAKDHYNRNFLRHQILPLVKQKFLISEQQIIEQSEKLQANAAWMQYALDNWLEEHLIKDSFSATLPFSAIPNRLSSTTALYHWLYPMGFSSKDIDAIHQMQFSQNGSFRENELYRITKTQLGFCLVQRNPSIPSNIQLEKKDGTFDWNGIKLESTLISKDDLFIIEKNKNVIQLDADKIQFPITIRIWQSGDKIQPLGMKGSMLISDYYTQKKIAHSLKNNFPVLQDKTNVIALLGLGISDIAKISKDTQTILQIRYSLPSTID